MRRVLVPALWIAFWLTALTAGAQARTLPIHFSATAVPSPVHPGEIVMVTVNATVDPGWHVYSVIPTPGGPATTEITAAEDWAAAGPTREDAPIRKMDPNFGKEVGFHEDHAAFTRQFRVPASATSSPLSITVHYQTCNDKICLPPSDAVVTAPITVAPGAVRAKFAQATATPVATAPSQPPGPKTGPSLLPFLLAALGAGLLAILTPCVFPLIPITLTNFVKQSAGDKARLVRLSGGYALGIVILYVALGVIVAGTAGAAGANQIAANPWVNLVEFVLFVVFALSFFETIQLSLPGNLGALQQSARQHGGTAGLLLLGVTFVLGSFTCTAPFVGTLLVTAANGQWARPILGMLVFALAFASPFFVFAAFPQWISKIPKGGLWLARFKATLGFIELAAALKFLSNADQVWQWHLLTQPVLLAGWAVICLLAALYLFGTLRFGLVAETEAAGAAVPITRRLIGTAFTLAAVYCFWGLSGRPISPYVGAFLPPAGYGGAGTTTEGAGLPWQSDYETALAQAKAEGKPLLIDFTGYTCTNCRLNEKNVFPRSPVQTELAKYVRVQLYTDGGKDGPKNQKFQQATFGDVALPLYGVINPQTGVVVDKTEGVQTVGGFRDFLARTRTAFAPAAQPSTPWAPYTAAAVAQAGQLHKPTIIDFTAKWCVNCRQIEHDVFEHPTVAPELNRDFVTLRADLTDWNSAPSTALQKKYGFVALPTIVFLDTTGSEIKPLRITGRLPVADFQQRMQQARTATAGPITTVAQR